MRCETQEDAKEFARAGKLKEVVKKYSSFVTHPILLGDERLNSVQALWALTPQVGAIMIQAQLVS
jgi:HSP90 family molecular chaperone